MKNTILLAAVTLVCAAQLTLAGEKKFVPVGIGGGGGILTPSFSPHDPNLVFASSDMSGIYRSTDQGHNWTMLPWRQLSQADTCPVTFHPTDPNTCYCVPGPWARQYLKVSHDKGITWANLSDQTPWEEFGQVNCIGLSPDAKVILLAAEKATVRTDDGGKTWAIVQGIGAVVHGFLFVPPPWPMIELIAPAPRWFAGTANGVMCSSDMGKTFTPCAKQPLDGKLIAFCGGKHSKSNDFVLFGSVATSGVDGKFVGGIYRSTDGGQTWETCMTKGLEPWATGADGAIISGKVFGINNSVNSPATTQKANGRGADARVTTQYPFLAMAANQTKVAYTFCFGNGDGIRASTVYKTEDAGKTWRPVLFPVDSQLRVGKTSTPDDEKDMKDKPAAEPGVKGNVELGWLNLDICWMSDRILGFTVNPANSDQVAFTNWMEIFLTYDGGKSWRQAYSRVAGVSPAAATQKEKTAGGTTTPPPMPRRGSAWESAGIEMTTTWNYRFDPHDPKRTYICYTDIGFARSEDRGKSWFYATAGSPWKNTFYDLAVDPDTPGLLYAATAYEHDIPSWKMAEHISGGGCVCVSTDYAKSWKPMNNGTPDKGPCMAVVIDPTSPKDKRTLWCAFYGGGVFKSTDGAQTWVAKNNGLKLDRNSHFVDLKRHKDGTLYALCGALRKERVSLAQGNLFKSTDGGESWIDLTDSLKLLHPYGFDVDPTDSKVIYLGACAVPRIHDPAGVYKTIDGGATWKKLDVPCPKTEISYHHYGWPTVDPYNPKRVWATCGTHGVLVSTDAGATWKELKGIPFRIVSRIAVDPADHETIYATTFGGGVWAGPAMGEE